MLTLRVGAMLYKPVLLKLIDKPAINARDRIDKGPWANANGAIVANGITNLSIKVSPT